MFQRVLSVCAIVSVAALSAAPSSAQSRPPVSDPVAQAIRAEQLRQAEQNPTSVAAAIVARWDAELRVSGKWNQTTPADLLVALSNLAPENLALAAEATTYKDMLSILASGRPSAPAPTLADVTTSSLVQRLGDSSIDLVFTPVTPCRIADTRIAGGVIPAFTSRLFDLDGSNLASQGGSATGCNLPFGVVSAAVLTTTVVLPDGPGYITGYGYSGPVPLAATMTYVQGDIRSTTSVIPDSPGGGGDFNVYTQAATHLVIDVVGYYAAPAATALDCTIATSALTSVPFNAWTAVDAVCPTGRSATGGGPYTTEGTGGFPGVWTISQPANASTWRTWVDNQTGGARTVQTWAQCCRVPGR